MADQPHDRTHPGPALRAADADASAGGTGAPPAPTAANQAPELTREYHTAAIAVQWYATRCIHSARCIRAQPAVFNPKRRPWIVLEGASADAVAAAVERCPTGALHYTRLDGGPGETVPNETTVAAVRDGPLYVRGDVTVAREDGTVIRRDTRVALCRCGQSAHMPFCDNSHQAAGFRDPG